MKYDIYRVDCSQSILDRKQPVYRFERPVDVLSKIPGTRPPPAGKWYVPAGGLDLVNDDPLKPRENSWVFVQQGDYVPVPLYSYTVPGDWTQLALFMQQIAWHAAWELSMQRLRPLHVVSVLGGPYLSQEQADCWLVFTNLCIRVEE